MAKVVFSLTDCQIELLGALRAGAAVTATLGVDPRTYTALLGVGLIVARRDQDGRFIRYGLTPAGESAVSLCERLASLKSLSDQKQ